MEQGGQTRIQRDRQQRQTEGEAGYAPRGEYNLSMDTIINADVRTRYGGDVGEIENMIFDRRGRITHAIIDVGGFLGIAEKPVAVPFDRLTYIGHYFVIYPGTEEQLEAMPPFHRSRLLGGARGYTGSSTKGGRETGEEARQ